MQIISVYQKMAVLCFGLSAIFLLLAIVLFRKTDYFKKMREDIKRQKKQTHPFQLEVPDFYKEYGNEVHKKRVGTGSKKVQDYPIQNSNQVMLDMQMQGVKSIRFEAVEETRLQEEYVEDMKMTMLMKEA